jgi:three-Cys-motif partner protein
MPSPYEHREQTEVKHRILKRYLEAFIPIVGNWADDITYIDCFAGPWQSADPDLKDTSFSHAIEVIRRTKSILASRGRTPTIRCLFIEKDPHAFTKLKAFCDKISDVAVQPENWDFTQHVSDVVNFATERKNSFPFVFIDPTGWQPLQISTIKPILRLVPGEVLINLMTSFIKRFLSDDSKGFDRLVGPDWQRLVSLSGEEQEEELVDSYTLTVRRTGRFRYVCTLPVMKPDQDAFHYHMVYATRHEKGVEVFKETEKIAIPFMHEARAQAQQRRRFGQTGQYSLLDAAAHYSERKLTQFHARKVNVAMQDLQSVLKDKGCLPYEQAWAITMQYSTVTEADLRERLAEWCQAGAIEITNLKSKQRVPRRSGNHQLKWHRDAKA